MSLLFIHEATAHNLIFDCGGVLFGTDKGKFLKKTGPLRIPLYAITHFKNPRTVLDEKLKEVPSFTPYDTVACDEKGNPLPPIMCDWLKGVPTDQILDAVLDTLGTSGAISSIAQGIFNPAIFAQTQYLYPDAEKFVRECVKAGHKVYILSNWDAESFALIKEKYSDFFDLFSGFIVSGECGMIKPNPLIYTYLLETYSLDPADCLFFDDQTINVQAARKQRIFSIRVAQKHGKPDYKKVRTKFNYWQNYIAPTA